jgi:hypothetical protein
MADVSRTTIIVLVALGATLAGFALASSASRLDGGAEAPEASVAAGPQKADLEWRETYGPPGEQVVFTVDSLEVTKTGWRARIGIENASSIAWELDPSATPGGTFGLQLFKTGEPDELEKRNKEQTLPAVRAATLFAPELPTILEPDASWEGVMSARGALVADSWVRVVFGTLIAVGKPPDELDEVLVWITDNTYRLRP